MEAIITAKFHQLCTHKVHNVTMCDFDDNDIILHCFIPTTIINMETNETIVVTPENQHIFRVSRQENEVQTIRYNRETFAITLYDSSCESK